MLEIGFNELRVRMVNRVAVQTLVKMSFWVQIVDW